MAAISTWSFGKKAVEVAKPLLSKNVQSLDATVKAISELEEDVETGPYLVGRGGYPNYDGVLQCDAALMSGKDLGFGAVAALEGISVPICVAEKVLLHSKHSFLVGTGAQTFAKSHGFKVQNNIDLITDKGRLMHQKYMQGKSGVGLTEGDLKAHDTLGLITMDKGGNITAGVTTSGMSLKHPGRVGDSPLPGCGLYADNSIGAACATGDGDDILKFCPCYHICMLMSMGKSPIEACNETVRNMCKKWFKTGEEKIFEVGVIAMSNKGEIGAATTISEWTDDVTGQKYKGFPYAVWNLENTNNIELRVATAIEIELS